MARSVFTLEAVAAKHGDCLLLHWGDRANPNLILIDGGAGGVYNRFLKHRLDELRQTRQDPLAIDLIMVSHIDEDHIKGVLDLTKRMEELENDGRPMPYEIDGMWFNAFDDITGNTEIAAFGTDPSAAIAVASQGQGHAALTIASVGQGRKLRDRANRLGVLVNDGDRLITDGFIWDMGKGLSFQILGPLKNRLEEFQEAWDKEVTKKGWAANSALANVAAYLDKSPYNLASTVVLAKLGSKTMLLTGDARGDDIIEGLQTWGLLTGRSMKVDILKVPHHGSDNNVSTEFFRQVRADHYLISGDGKHGNPEIVTLEMIRQARGSARYKVHLTYRDTIHGHKTELDKFLKKLPASEARKFVFRKSADLSMKIDLKDRVRD